MLAVVLLLVFWPKLLGDQPPKGWRCHVERGTAARPLPAARMCAGTVSTAIVRNRGAHSSTVLDVLARAGIPKRPNVIKARTTSDIAQESGAVPRTVTRALKRHGIPSRASTST